MKKTFRGGIVIDPHKITEHAPIVRLPEPKIVTIPLSQHIGAPCDAMVQVGERVLRYQQIGQATATLNCPVHASISGTVVAINERRTPAGGVQTEVVIENDGTGEELSLPVYDRDLKFVPLQEQLERIKQAGISGMGGATFPAHEKIRSAMGRVDTVIINCAECEPYITADHRILMEQTPLFLRGVADLGRLLNVKTVLIGIEDNKAEVIARLQTHLQGADFASIASLRTKYPQGDERQMIYALTGREIPQGKLPADVGCAVFNAQTTVAISRALHEGIPLVERVVTVSGDCVRNPKNLLVPLGTPIQELFAFCGGFSADPERILIGGPMMGRAQWDLQAPVTKGCSAVLALKKGQTAHYPLTETCIRCGRCVAHCPMHLLPYEITKRAKAQDFETCEALSARSCVECGCCSYVCPAQIPLVQHIGVAKARIAQNRRIAAMAQANTEKRAETPTQEK